MTTSLRIVEIFERHGAHAKVSSIHVNGWFGDYDKLTTSRLMMSELFGVDLEARRDRYVFSGDSPNDAPMFGFFPNAVGVANVRDFAADMDHLPRWITTARSGAGFVELAQGADRGARADEASPTAGGRHLRHGRPAVRHRKALRRSDPDGRAPKSAAR